MGCGSGDSIPIRPSSAGPIAINGQQLTVVGIAPPQYTGMLRGLSSEVWVPAMIDAAAGADAGASVVDEPRQPVAH